MDRTWIPRDQRRLFPAVTRPGSTPETNTEPGASSSPPGQQACCDLLGQRLCVSRKLGFSGVGLGDQLQPGIMHQAVGLLPGLVDSLRLLLNQELAGLLLVLVNFFASLAQRGLDLAGAAV